MGKRLCMLVALLPATVLAGFQVVGDADVRDEPVKSVAPAVRPQQGSLPFVALTYIGEPPDAIPVLNGFGRDLKLLDALKQIAPTGWKIYLKEDVAAKTGSVSWKGGRRWVDVLDIVANEQNVVVDVDWAKKQLYVGERLLVSAVAPRGQIWVAKTGATLKESVSEWGQKSGWQIVWNADFDYPILAQLTFDGAFMDAVVGVFRSYETAERPLLVDVHESQKLIVISPRK